MRAVEVERGGEVIVCKTGLCGALVVRLVVGRLVVDPFKPVHNQQFTFIIIVEKQMR